MVMGPGVGVFIRRLIRRQTGLAAGRMLRRGKGTIATRTRIRVHREVAANRVVAGVSLAGRRVGAGLEAAQSTISPASLRLGDRRFPVRSWIFRNPLVKRG